MQSFSNYISTALPRLLRTARRNVGKITLITLSTAGAAALAYHIHKTNRHITTTLTTERRAGAERLRTQFLATRPSLTAAFHAIYSTLLKTLQSHTLSNPDPFLALLRQNPSREEKTVLWRDVLYTSITRVCVCCVMASAVFIALTLEIELLARYAGQDADAGVAAAPKTVGAEARAAFIDCVRNGANTALEGILGKVRRIVEELFAETALTKHVRSDEMGMLLEEAIKDVDVAGMVMTWFADSEQPAAEEVVSFLKNEALDFCDVLDVEDLSNHAVRICVKELVNGVKEGPLVGGLAGLVKECERDLGEALVEDCRMTELGACVFLSGERGR